jgi:hypothetical protein
VERKIAADTILGGSTMSRQPYYEAIAVIFNKDQGLLDTFCRCACRDMLFLSANIVKILQSVTMSMANKKKAKVENFTDHN